MGLTGLLLLIIISVTSILLGVWIYSSDPKSKINIWFSLISICILLWNIFAYLGYSSADISLSSLFFKLNFFSVSLYFISFYFFTVYFPETSKKRSLVVDSIVTIAASFFAITTLFTNTIIRHVSIPEEGKLIVKMGPLGNYFYLFTILLTVYILYILFQKNRVLSEENKRKTKYFLLGTILYAVANVIFSIGVSFLYPENYRYTQLGDFSAILFLGFAAYAIMRHQLFNIKLIATESITVLLSIGLFIEIFISSNTPIEYILKFIVWALVSYGGSVMIKSVKQEIKQKEEIQELADELKHANRHLEEVDSLKTEFISMASHELLTPISAINGYLAMIIDEKLVKIEDEKARKYLDQVYGSSKRLAKLVTELLNISRIEQGRLLIEKTDLNLKEVAENVTAELKFKAEERKHLLKTNFVSSLEAISYADSDKVKEILINLCGNSIKYSPDNGEIEIGILRLSTAEVEKEYNEMEKISYKNEGALDSSLQNTIDEKLRQMIGGEQLVVYVKDNGLGLSGEDIPLLFKKFSRVGDSSIQKVQGNGLGLYLSKALTEMQHGRIWAKSDGRGKGSTFLFSLPEAKNKEEIIALDKQVKTADDAKPLAKSQ